MNNYNYLSSELNLTVEMSQMDRRYKCMNPVQTQILLSATLSGRRSEPKPARSVLREPRERDPWTGRVSAPSFCDAGRRSAPITGTVVGW